MSDLQIRVSGKLAADFIGIAVRAMKEAKTTSDTPSGPERNDALLEAAVCHQAAANSLGLAIDALKYLSGEIDNSQALKLNSSETHSVL